MNDWIAKMRKGDRRALSRLLSIVEERDAKAFALLEEIWPLTGKSQSIGITGPAGAGKSTLIDQLIHHLRSLGKKVGVIAVDPASPFSGGAVLGDRVRMHRHFNDADVFIRSVSARGRSGGVSFATRAQMQVLDAFGVDVMIVETVGAGQSEVDIADLVDTTLVVLVPEAGDSIQALKAGILEIADVFVVNKKDRPGADQVAAHLDAMMSLIPNAGKWRPPIVLTEAQSGDGIPKVWEAVQAHGEKGKEMTTEEKLRRNLHALSEIIEARLASEIQTATREDEKITKKLSNEARPNFYALAEEYLRTFKWDQVAKK
jgi:LAO/AO transport system kinase